MKMVLRASLNDVCEDLNDLAMFNRQLYERCIERKNKAYESNDMGSYLREVSSCSYHMAKIQTLDKIVNMLQSLHNYDVSKDVILK